MPQGVKRRTGQVKELARDAGFDLVGVAAAESPSHWDAYTAWLGRGFGGEMAYLGRNLDRRGDPRAILPGARSVLCVGALYHPGEGADEGPETHRTDFVLCARRRLPRRDDAAPSISAGADSVPVARQ